MTSQSDGGIQHIRQVELLRRIGLEPTVEQTRGQRQTGHNDLPGKGERVAKWMVRVKSKKCFIIFTHPMWYIYIHGSDIHTLLMCDI